ncbi:50S ribosomal protein L29 [Candidatus Kaiserbacteria bacterium RIFCSPLOWO2_01_FULL_54_13]|uniref:Large ribosomal subunit protein uL29 n=1 Tax=Candidatus Kaiserbacteria bacterium RIFCSPLOWO2_01_FULL_54_13 TaxID=1798512 RepID=A0A1F6F355_9BACT|nr:MAG: 50S ribosomal protein L29 [Candidatus Kaiserbacteria bacterium RIFCSPLOWO2_01_FULL_54_13]
MDDLKKQNAEDLKKTLLEKREALRVFRFGGAGSRTRNVREGRNLRKEIARILTEIRSREIPSSNTK